MFAPSRLLARCQYSMVATASLESWMARLPTHSCARHAPRHQGWSFRATNIVCATTTATRRITLSKPVRSLGRIRKQRPFKGTNIHLRGVDVDLMMEVDSREYDIAEDELIAACEQVMRLALLQRQSREPDYKLPHSAAVSLTICDDAYIQHLNRQYRNQDKATDVLSFELRDELDYKVHLPVKLLGDLVISAEVAQRQATARGHSLLDELRILLVHGALHLCGMDHEKGEEESREMQAAEVAIMKELGWKGQGLIEWAGDASVDLVSSGTEIDETQLEGHPADPSRSVEAQSPVVFTSSSDIQLIAIDMDGTLLRSDSQVCPRAAKAILQARRCGIEVVLATGKARTAAIKACGPAGLVGDSLLVSSSRPGCFLQGLAVYGREGLPLVDDQLSPEVVKAAFTYSLEQDVPLVAFLGDSCVTLKMTPELEELHHGYYEPLAEVASDLDALLLGPPVKKLLFMTSEGRIGQEVKPFWEEEVAVYGARVLQAVSTMVEVVPPEVDKWNGLQVLFRHLGISATNVMAIGDGGNDYDMVANAGIGVAVANAKAEVLEVASVVVPSNDQGGVAEAIETYGL